MPSPESNRRNLEHARASGRVIFWRTRGESQRIKGEIVLLHHTKPGLSQRVIARTFHVSQPYVAKLLKRVRLSSGIEAALGAEAYQHYREGREVERRAHFQAQGGPASLIGDSGGNSVQCHSLAWMVPGAIRHVPELASAFDAPHLPAGATGKVDEPAGTEYVELGRSTTGEVVEIHGSKPARTAPVYVPPPRPLTTLEIARLMGTGEFSVADQCPSFGRR
jgi:hypothetical protein